VARVFKRGELKQAILAILSVLGEAHGYAIMAELKERVGGRWQPSPGAIYPALLSLEELGLVTSADHDGTKLYTLTQNGLGAALGVSSAGATAGAWAALAARAREAAPRPSVGSLLDGFASQFPDRRRVLDPAQAQAVEKALEQARAKIQLLIEKGERDG